jgi:hypothetical protein
MTKPSRIGSNEVKFYVAGGALDTNQTEIYEYRESLDDGTAAWTQLSVNLDLSALGFSFF